MHSGRVTLELVDEAAVLLDGLDHHPEELVEHAHDLAGRTRRGQLGRPDQVDEQHRDIAFLAAELGAAFQGAAGRHPRRRSGRTGRAAAAVRSDPEPCPLNPACSRPSSLAS